MTVLSKLAEACARFLEVRPGERNINTKTFSPTIVISNMNYLFEVSDSMFCGINAFAVITIQANSFNS